MHVQERILTSQLQVRPTRACPRNPQLPLTPPPTGEYMRRTPSRAPTWIPTSPPHLSLRGQLVHPPLFHFQFCSPDAPAFPLTPFACDRPLHPRRAIWVPGTLPRTSTAPSTPSRISAASPPARARAHARRPTPAPIVLPPFPPLARTSSSSTQSPGRNVARKSRSNSSGSFGACSLGGRAPWRARRARWGVGRAAGGWRGAEGEGAQVRGLGRAARPGGRDGGRLLFQSGWIGRDRGVELRDGRLQGKKCGVRLEGRWFFWVGCYPSAGARAGRCAVGREGVGPGPGCDRGSGGRGGHGRRRGRGRVGGCQGGGPRRGQGSRLGGGAAHPEPFRAPPAQV